MRNPKHNRRLLWSRAAARTVDRVFCFLQRTKTLSDLEDVANALS